MASISQHTSLDVEVHESNSGITNVTWRRFTASDCLPICQRPPPAKSPQNLGKIIIGLTFQAIVGLFIASPSSSPPLSSVLFLAAMLISFAVSLIGLFLQNAYPRIAVLFGKIGALFVAFGVYIIASLLIHQNFVWICWLACALSLLAFIISFR